MGDLNFFVMTRFKRSMEPFRSGQDSFMFFIKTENFWSHISIFFQKNFDPTNPGSFD